tara:strand:- start:3390 stop:4790 length:1401 start_codon:yes stop_codon:yes gene_type:complete
MGIKSIVNFRSRPVYFFLTLQFIISFFLGHNFFINGYEPIGDEIDYVYHMNAMLERLETNGFVADSFNINVDRLPGFPVYLAAIKSIFSSLKISEVFYQGIFLINLIMMIWVANAIYYLLLALKIDKVISLLASTLLITSPTIIRYEFSILTEIPYLFSIIYIINYLFKVRASGGLSLWSSPLVASTIVFSCLTKIHMFYLLMPAVLLIIFWAIRSKRVVFLLPAAPILLGLMVASEMQEARIDYVESQTGRKVASTLIFLNLNSEMIAQTHYYEDYPLSAFRSENRDAAQSHNEVFNALYIELGPMAAYRYSLEYRMQRIRGVMLSLTNNLITQVTMPDYGFWWSRNVAADFYAQDQFTDIFYIVSDAYNGNLNSFLVGVYYFAFTVFTVYGFVLLGSQPPFGSILGLSCVFFSFLLGPYLGILIGAEPRFRIPQLPFYALAHAYALISLVPRSIFGGIPRGLSR